MFRIGLIWVYFPVIKDDTSTVRRAQREPQNAKSKGQTMSYYNGSRNKSLVFYAGICFTECEQSAAAYGEHVAAVEIDRSRLSIQTIAMTEDELQQAIDDQEWPCDRQRDIDAAIAAGYDAVKFADCDERGQMHDCIRILTQAAWDAAVSAA